MNSFTVIAYVLPEGGHHVETLAANDSTDAVIRLREKLQLSFEEFEVVAVARGAIEFVLVDSNRVALAPYAPTSP